MSGYSRFEQAIGSTLTRFPRLKSVVETAYQRVSYHALADSDFEYEVHNDAELYSASEWADIPNYEREYFVGFYDVCPWNESKTQYLVHAINDDAVSITALGEGEATKIAKTNAWNYQQGSRTQWHPTRSDVVLYNDIEEDSVVAKMIGTDGEIRQMYSWPIQAVSPTGTEYISINYQRLDRNSPGYGYGTDDNSSLASPDTDGVIRTKFDNSAEVLISFSDLMSSAGSNISHRKHYIHHVLYAPDGDHFVFLHRWKDGEKRNTRLIVSDNNGDWTELLAHPNISHFCWLDAERLFMWGGSEEYGRGYHIINIESGEVTYVPALEGYGDGHPSLSPDGNWIVTDTYPDRTRRRTLWLYHLDSGRLIKLGEFLAPFEFDGKYRCDLHPRWGQDGRFVSVDSAHEGFRHSYVLDVSTIC